MLGNLACSLSTGQQRLVAQYRRIRITGWAGTAEDFFASGMLGSDSTAPLFPAYLRYLVRHNSRRRMMVQLFTVLSAESLNPEHPLHDEFTARMDDIWENYSRYPWLIPP